MGSRRGRGKNVTTRPQYFDPEAEGRRRETDAQFVRDARRRQKTEAQRKWIIRLGIVAALALVIHLWGADIRYFFTSRGKTAAYEAQQAEDNVRGNMDERTGANFDTNP